MGAMMMGMIEVNLQQQEVTVLWLRRMKILIFFMGDQLVVAQLGTQLMLCSVFQSSSRNQVCMLLLTIDSTPTLSLSLSLNRRD